MKDIQQTKEFLIESIGYNVTLSKEVIDWFEIVMDGKVPKYTPKSMTNDRQLYRLRDMIVSKIGFVLVDEQWTKQLSDYIGDSKVLEIMCGSGFLSNALQQNGVNIISTDNKSWERHWQKHNNFYTNIIKMDAIESIEKYGKEVDYILMSWAYMDDTAYRSLIKMREINPDCKMIVIGEDLGGCTCDDNFFYSAKIAEEVDIELPSWKGIYDNISIVK